MKVMPAPLGIEETEQVVRCGSIPNQRWLLVFDTEQEAKDVKKFLIRSMYDEDGYLKSE